MANEENYPWVCELCYPDAIEVGMLAPGKSLIYREGKFQVLGGQGHRDDEDMTFDVKPTPEMTDEEATDDPDSTKKWCAWFDGIPEAKMDPGQGYRFVLACAEGGYNLKEDGNVLVWLFDKAGKMIRDYEQKHGPIET